MQKHVMRIVKRLSSALFAGAFLGWAATVAAAPAADGTGQSLATAALMKKPPKIDGEISAGEWDGAVRTSLFSGWRRMKFQPRQAKAWMGFDRNNLYIAVESELRPGGLIAEKTFDDGRLVFDSAIEVWIDPNRESRERGKGDLGYYQIIGNSIGTLKDVKYEPSPNTGWSMDGEFANVVDEERGVWMSEISIPWKSLGWEAGAQTGRSIGLVIARDFKNPWVQPTWMPLGNAFSSLGSYPEVRLTEAAPVVGIESLRHDTFSSKTPLIVRVDNPGDQPRQVQVDLLITSTDMPKIEMSKTLDVAPGGVARFEYQVPENRLHERAKHTMTLTATDTASGDLLFRHKGGNWEKAPEKLWHVRTGPNPAAAAKIGYYPSYKLLKVWVRPSELGETFDKTRKARITVTAAGGERLHEENFEWAENNATGVAEITLPDVPKGVHSVTVEVDGFDEPIVRHFEERDFVWENNQLGITTEIFPPFQPIRRGGDAIEVVMRKYRSGGLGLWDSVQARSNEGGFKELLAGPMTVRLSQDSPALDAAGEALVGAGEWTSVKPHEAIYRGEAVHPAVQIKTTAITEYDGCMRVEMNLAPNQKDAEIKHLWVDIPIKNEMAPLFHVSTTALRFNPAGSIPEGDGIIWDTRDFPDGEWPTGFRPYIWLGAEERGLCWFADNDKNWVKDVNLKKGTYAPAFSLHRKDGVLTLRVHLVQKPVVLQRERHIVFGLMATPAKPMPETWRAEGRPDHPSLEFRMGHGFGLFGRYACKYPINYDWAAFDASYARRIGDAEKLAEAHERLETWRERNVDERFMQIDFIRNRTKAIDKAYSYGGAGAFTVYFEEFHSTFVQGGHEAPAFYTEWTGKPLAEWMFRDPPPAIIGLSTGALVDSYQDFACWYAAEWLKRGAGIYFDNSFPKRVTDPLTTDAYEWNGIVVPSAGVWNHREYLRRIWIMHQQLRDPKAPQGMMIHMTNTHIAPYMVWNEYNLDMEWGKSDEVLQKRFHPDMLRAESLGLKTGNIPVVLHFSGGPAMLVHEIKTGISIKPYPEPLVEFGYGLDDCEVINYWDENVPLNLSDEQCKWLLLKRNGKLLIYLVSWNGDPARVKATLDLDALGIDVEQVTDADTGEPVATLEGGAFTVPMEGFGVRTLIVE